MHVSYEGNGVQAELLYRKNEPQLYKLELKLPGI